MTISFEGCDLGPDEAHHLTRILPPGSRGHVDLGQPSVPVNFQAPRQCVGEGSPIRWRLGGADRRAAGIATPWRPSFRPPETDW
jgi:hypothetical protein